MKHLNILLNGKGKAAALLEPVDRVIIIASSCQPYAVEKPKDFNAFKDFFSKIVFLPRPDYYSRQVLWTSYLAKLGVERPNPDEVQTLSRISEYYSSGSIANVVKRTLTSRRIERLARKPFSINELIGPLAKEEPIYHNVDQQLRDWYHKTLGVNTKPASAEGSKKDKKREGREESQKVERAPLGILEVSARPAVVRP